jgi:hypothetical protein
METQSIIYTSKYSEHEKQGFQFVRNLSKVKDKIREKSPVYDTWQSPSTGEFHSTYIVGLLNVFITEGKKYVKKIEFKSNGTTKGIDAILTGLGLPNHLKN